MWSRHMSRDKIHQIEAFSPSLLLSFSLPKNHVRSSVRAMAEVQLVVKHVRTDVTINLNVALALALGPGGEGAEARSPEAAAQARSTAAACVSSIAALGSNDPDPTYVCRGREGGEFMSLCVVITRVYRFSQEDRANLQFAIMDCDEEARQGASYGTLYGEFFRGFADQIQQQVDEFTDGVVDEDPAQAIASLQNELDGVFDVTEGQGSDGNNTNIATCEVVMSFSLLGAFVIMLRLRASRIATAFFDSGYWSVWKNVV